MPTAGCPVSARTFRSASSGSMRRGLLTTPANALALCARLLSWGSRLPRGDVTPVGRRWFLFAHEKLHISHAVRNDVPAGSFERAAAPRQRHTEGRPLMTARLYPGDRVRYLEEPATFGTLLSVPFEGCASLRLDDGRAIRVRVAQLSRISIDVQPGPADRSRP